MRFIQIFIHIQGVFTQGSEVYPGEYPEASPPNSTGLSVFSSRSVLETQEYPLASSSELHNKTNEHHWMERDEKLWADTTLMK